MREKRPSLFPQDFDPNSSRCVRNRRSRGVSLGGGGGRPFIWRIGRCEVEVFSRRLGLPKIDRSIGSDNISGLIDFLPNSPTPLTRLFTLRTDQLPLPRDSTEKQPRPPVRVSLPQSSVGRESTPPEYRLCQSIGKSVEKYISFGTKWDPNGPTKVGLSSTG